MPCKGFVWPPSFIVLTFSGNRSLWPIVGKAVFSHVGHMLIRREFLIISATIAIVLAIYIPNIHISFNNWDMDAYRRVLYAEKPLDMAWRLLTDFQGRIVTGYYAPLSSISLMLDKLVARSQFPRV